MKKGIIAMLVFAALAGCITRQLESGNPEEIASAVNEIATGEMQKDRVQQIQNLAMGIDRDARPYYLAPWHIGDPRYNVRKGYDSEVIREAALKNLRTAIEKTYGRVRATEDANFNESVESELLVRRIGIAALKPVFDDSGVLKDFEVRKGEELIAAMGDVIDNEEYFPFYLQCIQYVHPGGELYSWRASEKHRYSVMLEEDSFWGVKYYQQCCNQIVDCLMKRDKFIRWSLSKLSDDDQRMTCTLIEIWVNRGLQPPSSSQERISSADVMKVLNSSGSRGKATANLLTAVYCALYSKLSAQTKDDTAKVISALRFQAKYGEASKELSEFRQELVSKLDREQVMGIVNGDRDEDPELYWMAWRSVVTNEDAVKLWNSKAAKETRREAITGITDQKLLAEIANGSAYFAPTAIGRVESRDVLFTIACNTEKDDATRASAAARFLVLSLEEKSEDSRIVRIGETFVGSRLFVPYYRSVKKQYNDGKGFGAMEALNKLLLGQADSIKKDGNTVAKVTVRVGDYRLGLFYWEVETLFEAQALAYKDKDMRIVGERKEERDSYCGYPLELMFACALMELAQEGEEESARRKAGDVDVRYFYNEFGKVTELRFSAKMLQRFYAISEINASRWAECFAECVSLNPSAFSEGKYYGEKYKIEVLGGNKLSELHLTAVGNLPPRKKIEPPSPEQYAQLTANAKRTTSDPVLLPLAEHGFCIGMKMNDAVQLVAKLFPDEELTIIEKKDGSVAKLDRDKLLFAYANKDGDVVELNFSTDMLGAMKLDWRYRDNVLYLMPKDVVKYERKGEVLCRQEARCKKIGDLVVRYFTDEREIDRLAISTTLNTTTAFSAGAMMGLSPRLTVAAIEDAKNDMLKKFQDPNGQFPDKGILRICKGERTE